MRELGDRALDRHREERAVELDVVAHREIAIRASGLDEASIERIERVRGEHPRIAPVRASDVRDGDLVPIASALEREAERQRHGFDGDRQPVALLQRVALAKELGHALGLGRFSRAAVALLSAVFAHALSFAFASGIAQASPDAGLGVFVSAAQGRMFEGRRAAPLGPTGDVRAAEVGVLVPGGSTFLLEAGVRGEMSPAGQGFIGRHVGHQIALFGGVRISVFGPRPILLGLIPLVRAGLELAAIRDRITTALPLSTIPAGEIANDRVSIGPRFALGIERELWFGTSIGVYLDGHARVAPVLGSLGVAIAISAQALP
jgi:hypothetical protein